MRNWFRFRNNNDRHATRTYFDFGSNHGQEQLAPDLGQAASMPSRYASTVSARSITTCHTWKQYPKNAGFKKQSKTRFV